MKAVIFIGIQATGKSTFYRDRFVDFYIRINLDMLNTRRKERMLLDACLAMNQSFVVDNTNPTEEDRTRYIRLAKQNGFEVDGYYFQSEIEAALQRNSSRMGKKKIPEAGIRSTYSKLELPDYHEGFDHLYYVSINESGEFEVNDWESDK